MSSTPIGKPSLRVKRRAPAAGAVRRSICLLSWLVAASPVQATTYALPPQGIDVVGQVRYVTARYEDTLADLAKRYDVGFREILAANPGVDPWLPGAGTRVAIPLQFVLPDAPRRGIVLNLPEMRLYYYPVPKPGQTPLVMTYPVGIGREGWSTPLGLTKVVAKTADPTWYPPESIRREHAQDGEMLPASVPPGPDNPLGKYALQLGIPGYLIHGTNKPYGPGMRVSHGCIRLYAQDIEYLFRGVPLGTPVRVIDQPYKAGWNNGVLYLESHRPLADGDRARADLTPAVRAILAATSTKTVTINWDRATDAAAQNSGVPVAIYP
jgi:L,D-transpeptidase ErfK/SrfK